MPAVKKNVRARSSSKPGSTIKRARQSTLTRSNIVTTPSTKKFGYGPFAEKRQATYKYVDFFDITLAAGKGSFLFSANGMFDPNITGIGHQPMYFDQSMAIYDHYTVVSSKFKLTPVGSTGATAPIHVTVLTDDDANLNASNTTTALERPGAKSAYFAQLVTVARPMSLTWKAKNVFTGDPLSKAELSGDASNNPSEQTYFAIFISSPSLDSGPYSFKVELEYTAVMHELKSIGQS